MNENGCKLIPVKVTTLCEYKKKTKLHIAKDSLSRFVLCLHRKRTYPWLSDYKDPAFINNRSDSIYCTGVCILCGLGWLYFYYKLRVFKKTFILSLQGLVLTTLSFDKEALMFPEKW